MIKKKKECHHPNQLMKKRKQERKRAKHPAHTTHSPELGPTFGGLVPPWLNPDFLQEAWCRISLACHTISTTSTEWASSPLPNQIVGLRGQKVVYSAQTDSSLACLLGWTEGSQSWQRFWHVDIYLGRASFNTSPVGPGHHICGLAGMDVISSWAYKYHFSIRCRGLWLSHSSPCSRPP